MLAGQLINFAWILSGIVARDLDEVQGSQGRDGLFWFNQLLAEKATTGRHIPYYKHISFALTVGQEKYFIPNLVDVTVASFNIGSVRYQMFRDTRNHYWGAPRIDNVNALPFTYYSERVNGGSDIYVYWKPQSSTYILNVTGTFFPDGVTEDIELNDTFDLFYQSYLMYELANRLCDWYKVTLPDQTVLQLAAFKQQILDLNPIDFTIQKPNSLGCSGIMTYAQANFGKGFTAPGYGRRGW